MDLSNGEELWGLLPQTPACPQASGQQAASHKVHSERQHQIHISSLALPRLSQADCAQPPFKDISDN